MTVGGPFDAGFPSSSTPKAGKVGTPNPLNQQIQHLNDALPLALAFGVSSGLGAAYGLYGAIFIGFFAAIFGGTAVQISGPTGPMTVVTAAAATLGGLRLRDPGSDLTTT